MAPKLDDSLQYRKDRLSTFTEGVKISSHRSLKKWSLSTVDVNDLADCGFFYSPTKSFPNQITCYWCGKKEKSVSENTSIASQHLLNNPECPFSLIAFNLKQFILTTEKDSFWETLGSSSTAPKSVIDPYSEESIALRQSTFKNLWKFDSKRKCRVTSRNLSEAGFYYSPVQEGSDRVICMYCDCPLEDWDRNDDPLQEHKNNSFTHCFFLDSIGKERKNEALISLPDEPPVEDSPNDGIPSKTDGQAVEATVETSNKESIKRGAQSELSELIGNMSSPVPDRNDELPINLRPRLESGNDSIMDLLLSEGPPKGGESFSDTKSQGSLEPKNEFDAFEFSIDDLENQDKGTIFTNKDIISQKKYSRKNKKQSMGATLLTKVAQQMNANGSDSAIEEWHPVEQESDPIDPRDASEHKALHVPDAVKFSPSKNTSDILFKSRNSFALNSEIEDPDNQDRDELEVFEGDVESQNAEVGREEEEEEEIENLSMYNKSDLDYIVGADGSDFKASMEDESLIREEDSSFISDEALEEDFNHHVVRAKNKKRKDKSDWLQSEKRLKQVSRDESDTNKATIFKSKGQKSLFSDDMDIDQAQLDKILNSPRKARKMKILKPSEEGNLTQKLLDLSNQNIGDYDESNISFIEGNVNLPAKSETLRILNASKTTMLKLGNISNETEVLTSLADLNSSPSKHILPLSAPKKEEKVEMHKAHALSEVEYQSPGLDTKSLATKGEPNNLASSLDTRSKTIENNKNIATAKHQASTDMGVPGSSAHYSKQSSPLANKESGNVVNKPEIEDPINEKHEAKKKKLSIVHRPNNSEAHITNDNNLRDLTDSNLDYSKDVIFAAQGSDAVEKGQASHKEGGDKADVNIDGTPEDANIDRKEDIAEKNSSIGILTVRNLSNGSHETKDVELFESNKALAVSKVTEMPWGNPSKPQSSMAPFSTEYLKMILKEELKEQLKEQLRAELRAEIHRELLKEELRVEIQRELLQEHVNKTAPPKQVSVEQSKPERTEESTTAKESLQQSLPVLDQPPPLGDQLASQMETSGIRNVSLSPSSYREYVKDMEKLDEEFSENTFDRPKKIEAAETRDVEGDNSAIEDSASEQLEILQLTDIETKGHRVENRGSEELEPSNLSITSPLAQGSTFSDPDSVSAAYVKEVNIEEKVQSFSHVGLESSPQNFIPSTIDNDARGNLGPHKETRLPHERKLKHTQPDLHDPKSTNESGLEPHLQASSLNPLSMERVISEMQALLETIDYLSEVFATQRELHDDTEGLITLFVAAMPEEEEFLGVKEWMVHNASTCGRTVREISGRLIAAYEREFDELIEQVGLMDTID